MDSHLRGLSLGEKPLNSRRYRVIEWHGLLGLMHLRIARANFVRPKDSEAILRDLRALRSEPSTLRTVGLCARSHILFYHNPTAPFVRKVFEDWQPHYLPNFLYTKYGLDGGLELSGIRPPTPASWDFRGECRLAWLDAQIQELL